MTLRVGWKRLVIGDLARIGRVKTAHVPEVGRVILSRDGENGAQIGCLVAPSAFTAAAPLSR